MIHTATTLLFAVSTVSVIVFNMALCIRLRRKKEKGAAKREFSDRQLCANRSHIARTLGDSVHTDKTQEETESTQSNSEDEGKNILHAPEKRNEILDAQNPRRDANEGEEASGVIVGQNSNPFVLSEC